MWSAGFWRHGPVSKLFQIFTCSRAENCIDENTRCVSILRLPDMNRGVYSATRHSKLHIDAYITDTITHDNHWVTRYMQIVTRATQQSYRYVPSPPCEPRRERRANPGANRSVTPDGGRTPVRTRPRGSPSIWRHRSPNTPGCVIAGFARVTNYLVTQ